ncbi:MAG: site-specific DNA-methyltransferase, partial [Clostridia bacterium]|nr:site-specific DNA-methyltransferase [Clostridia bacterium]
MMYPRLQLARNILTEDGVIFISIDDNEVHNLRKICDEVFGEENFVSQLIWERAYSPKNDAKYISNSHDYVIMYAKTIAQYKIGRLPRTDEANARYQNPDNDPRGVWKPSDMSVKTYNEECDYPITTPTGRVIEPPTGRCWSLSKKAFLERLQDNRIYFGSDGNSVPCIKRFLTELKFDGMAPQSIMFYKDVGHSQEGAQEVTKLIETGAFDGPKPVRLLRRLLTLANTERDSIILDFFSGSATTAHAVMQINAEDGGNRKFIMVQLPEETDPKSEAYKAGYKNICEIGKERIRRAGKKIEEELKAKSTKGDLFEGDKEVKMVDTGFRVLKVDSTNMKDVYYSPSQYNQQMLLELESNIKDDRTDIDLLYGVLLEWGVPLSLPHITEK